MQSRFDLLFNVFVFNSNIRIQNFVFVKRKKKKNYIIVFISEIFTSQDIKNSP